jgi:hypothetical protein
MNAALSHIVRNEFLLAREHRNATRELRARALKARLRSETLRRQTRAFSLHALPPRGIEPDVAPLLRRSTTNRDENATRLTAELDQAHAAVDHLRAALASRDLIWEAKLIIAAAVGCDAADAHQLLVKQSQHENLKMRDVAAAIVQRQRA